MKTRKVYFHIENGGHHLSVEDGKPPTLTYYTIHYGNKGPSVSIPLLTNDQIDHMINLLQYAKSHVEDDKYTYDFDIGENDEG